MRVTPLDIRQKSFERHFRGYDKDEVNGFLLTLSQEWERSLDDNKELRIKLESAEREVTKLREVETSLYKTLKTAEDTGANVIEQARNTAELHLRETQMKADGVLNEARMKAKNTIDESEMRAKNVVGEMEERLKQLIDNYKKIETSRDDLISEFKRLASDALDRVERAKKFTLDFDPDRHLNDARRESQNVIYPNGQSFSARPIEMPERVQQPVIILEPQKLLAAEEEPTIQHEEPVVVEAEPKRVQRSFFDSIE